MTRRAFTLIELLVVIAIIGVLIGILVPVLASARQAAFGSVCLANQSQLMVAVHQHAADFKGLIPYGPEENNGGESNGADDFYIVNGMTTSLISTKSGEACGAGLLINDYLSDTPEVLFCPGSDQEVRVNEELARVGTGSAISGYSYRHGGNTLTDLLNFRISGEPLDDHLKIDALGKNGNGNDIRALFVDNNFLLAPGSSFYDLFHRSNHNQAFVNIAYADGHAEQRGNNDGRYSADIVGTSLYSAVDKMLDVFERADLTE